MLKIRYRIEKKRMEEFEIIKENTDYKGGSVKSEVIELNFGIKDQLKIEPKRFKKLERGFIATFLHPSDSDYRKRYLRRWIFGEDINPKNKVIT